MHPPHRVWAYALPCHSNPSKRLEPAHEQVEQACPVEPGALAGTHEQLTRSREGHLHQWLGEGHEQPQRVEQRAEHQRRQLRERQCARLQRQPEGRKGERHNVFLRAIKERDEEAPRLAGEQQPTERHESVVDQLGGRLHQPLRQRQHELDRLWIAMDEW
eukprot:scaffold111007_cov63-Phaeocystis_antarctica.AAC.1